MNPFTGGIKQTLLGRCSRKYLVTTPYIYTFMGGLFVS